MGQGRLYHAAGRCIVAFAERTATPTLVILGCDTPDHLFAECDDLFRLGLCQLCRRPLVDTQTVLTTVDLTKCALNRQWSCMLPHR